MQTIQCLLYTLWRTDLILKIYVRGVIKMVFFAVRLIGRVESPPLYLLFEKKKSFEEISSPISMTR